MFEKIKDAAIREVMADTSLDRAGRIARLTKLREDARAEQRMASEAPAVDDDGLNSRLRDVELALEHLGQDPSEEEGKGAATL
ncbi:MAG: hypothetical protein KDJ87_02835 [Rhizobiaceae bacterium]|nr:hypothetical protein [Rhizobiaceae bacterium]